MIKLNRFMLGYGVISTAIIIILMLTRGCGSKGGQVIYNGADTVKIIDTIEVVKEVPVFVPKLVVKTLPGERFIDSIPYADSNYCKGLAVEHFAKKEYIDTIRYDSGEVYIREWISQNNIDSISMGYNVKIPYIQTIIQPVKNRVKVYIKGNIGTNGLGFFGGPEIAITDKGNFMYSAGVDFNTVGGPIYRVGVGWKIHFRRQ